MPPNASQITLLRRDANNDGPSTGLIVGVVCGALGGLIALLFLIRAMIRMRIFRPAPAPLPPVQELAHHRAADLVATAKARAAASQQEWHEHQTSQKRPRPYPVSDGSAVSLVRPETATPTTQEHGSFLSRETSDGPFVPLPAPQLPFVMRRQSQSTTSDTSILASPGFNAPSYVSTSVVTFHPPQPSSSTTSLSAHRSRSRPPQPSASRAHSTNSSISKGTGRSRGAPHSRRSTMQIILPAPLAPQLSNWSSVTTTSATSPSSPDKRTRRYSSVSSHSHATNVDSWVHASGRSKSREREDSSGASRRRSRTPANRRTAKTQPAAPPTISHTRSISSPESLISVDSRHVEMHIEPPLPSNQAIPEVMLASIPPLPTLRPISAGDAFRPSSSLLAQTSIPAISVAAS